ncbi:uncharacterized protein LOC142344018 isoform X2 [Convolutriloba macropyga]
MEPEPIHDPLDYLAKYCIITKERVPLYKRVFAETLERQRSMEITGSIDYEDKEDSVINKFRLMRRQKSQAFQVDAETGEILEPKGSIVNPDDLPQNPENEVIAEEREPFEGDFDPKLNLELDLTKRSVHSHQQLMSQEELLDKINFTIGTIEARQFQMSKDNLRMEKESVKLVCQFARNELREELFPRPEPANAKKKGKKDKKGGGKGKKGGKKGAEQVEFPEWMNTELVEDVKTDEYVMARLTEDQWDMLASDRLVEPLTLQIGRNLQKIEELEKRKDQLTTEKATLQLDYKESRAQDTFGRPPSVRFRRRQSDLYQMTHPSPDPEMETELLEEALRQVNDQLITEKECQYIFYILDLPKRERVNVRLFCVIAALSERIKMLEPVIRKLINQLDFEALQVKMDRAKDLFYLLDDQQNSHHFNPTSATNSTANFLSNSTTHPSSRLTDPFQPLEDKEYGGGLCGEGWPVDYEQEALPRGTVSAKTLAVELAAGGITSEHADQVIDKFCREKRGQVEFLDFLTYMPLFVEIHEHIKANPLTLTRYK